MHGPYSGTSQHGIGGLGNHRHVKHDAVAFADAKVFIDVGHFTDLRVHFAIGDVFAVFGVVAFPNDCGLFAAGFQMAVDTIGRDVQHPVFKPFDRDIRMGITDIFGD